MGQLFGSVVFPQSLYLPKSNTGVPHASFCEVSAAGLIVLYTLCTSLTWTAKYDFRVLPPTQELGNMLLSKFYGVFFSSCSLFSILVAGAQDQVHSTLF